MHTTKKSTRLVMLAIATTITTLALCACSVYCTSQNQQHTWLLRLLANTNTMLLLIISQLLSQVFLLLSVVLYCRPKKRKQTEHKNWTRHLDHLLNHDL
jgi:nitrogen fixation/metabolism regulation signal transduction histidine kinase